VLNDGRALLAVGKEQRGNKASRIYDPATNTW
jgi:hypothetical protein